MNIAKLMFTGQEIKFPQLVISRKVQDKINRSSFNIMGEESLNIQYQSNYYTSKPQTIELFDKRVILNIAHKAGVKKNQRFGVHYIHGLDSWCMRRVINHMPYCVSPIHDSYGVPGGYINKLRTYIRELYISIQERDHFNITALYKEKNPRGSS